MKKVILVGGRGFIGQYLLRRLSKNKEYSAQVIGRSSNLKEDLDSDTEILIILTQPNLDLIQEIGKQIKLLKKLQKIIYLSTLQVYPASNKRLNEEVEPNPDSEYEKLKFHEEGLLTEFINKTKVKLCIARISNVYGDVKNKGIISKLLNSVLSNKEDLVINGDPEKKIKDFIFIEDVVKFLDFLIFYKQSKQKDVFNICTGRGHSLKAVIDTLEKIIKKNISFKRGKEVKEKLVNIGDNSKIIITSGQKLTFSLTRGLKKTFANYIKHLS